MEKEEERVEQLRQNEFLSVYYNLEEYQQAEFSYQDVFYRLYGVNKESQRYESIPRGGGTYFRDLANTYEYIEHVKDSYSRVDIITYDPILHQDELYDSIFIQNPLKRNRKKS